MNCNNCTNNNALKEVKIKHVHGNVLRMAIPLTLRTIELVDGEINATDTPFIPSSEHPVKVVFSKGSVSVALDATMKDGNIAYIEEKGKIPVGTYAITVTCNDDNGNPYRFKQNAVLYVADATIEAGIEETIEYEVTTWYLDAAIFLALKGEDGVGIYDIDTQSSGEIGGVNTVTFILTDGRTRSFNVLNGSGAVDSDLDINSPSPIANSAVTAKFNELSGELADLFGDVDYDTSSKSIRFWDKGKTNVLASLDARPFIKDGMVSNAYISNNTLVITFNTDSGKEAIGVPLTSVFNPNNYYTKTQVDSRIASAVANINLSNYYTKSQVDGMYSSLSSRVTPVEVVFTRNGNNYTCNTTLTLLNTHVSNHKPITAKLGSAIGVLLHCDEDYAVFQFADDLGGTFILWCNHGYWERHDGADIEIDDNPTEDSTNAVSSGGVFAALSQKVAGISVNGGTTQFPTDGIVDLTVEGGSDGYEPPVGGIPKTDLASGVQSSLDAADSAYQKPSGGIPSTDMTSAVQTSLGKADTAYQKPSGGIPASDLASGVIPDVSGFVTSSDVQTAIAGLVDSAPETLDTLNELAAALGDDKDFATTMSTALGNKVDKVSGKGLSTNDYTDAEKTKLAGLSNYDDTTLAGRVTTLENAGYLTSETDPTVPSWAKASSKPSYTASEVGAVPTTRKVNNKALSEDITLLASDVGAVSSTGYVATDNNFTSTLKDKLDGIEAGAEVNVQPNWTQTNTSADDYIKNKPTLATVATSGSYNDLSNKPTIPSGDNDIVGISDGTASDGAVVFSKRNGDTVTLDFNHSHPQYALANSLSTVATSGDYDDLTGKPTKVSDFTNDSGFLTGVTFNGTSATVTSGVAAITATIPDVSGKANASEMDVSTSGDQTTITLKTGTSATVINQHQSLSGYAKYVLLADEAAYNALATKDSSTLYLIPE